MTVKIISINLLLPKHLFPLIPKRKNNLLINVESHINILRTQIILFENIIELTSTNEKKLTHFITILIKFAIPKTNNKKRWKLTCAKWNWTKAKKVNKCTHGTWEHIYLASLKWIEAIYYDEMALVGTKKKLENGNFISWLLFDILGTKSN